MTNKERVNKFRLEEIAVNCETEEEAKAFVKWCFDNGMGWGCGNEDETFFNSFKNKTCYSFDYFTGDECLVYDSESYCRGDDYEVITYKDFMKENKMTNLEVAVSKGLINIGNALCGCAHIIKYGGRCNDKGCDECEFNNDVNLCVKTLLEKYKEPIKLTRFEYDLLDYFSFLGCGAKRFEYYNITKYLFYTKGHFKGVYDTSMTLQEILDNCEIVADDYDFWGVKEDK